MIAIASSPLCSHRKRHVGISIARGEGALLALSVLMNGHRANINNDALVDDDDFTLSARQYNSLFCSDPAIPDA